MTTWLWGTKYPWHYAERLEAGVRRHLRGEYTFTVCRPQPEDEHLAAMPGCFARLRAFDPDWQRQLGARDGDRIACLDLDLVVTGGLDPLFDRDEPFVILQGANASNPCPYNGSVWMLRAGYRPDVWSGFSTAEIGSMTFFEFPDDQGWLWYKMPGAAGWECGADSGIYAFGKRNWPKGEGLPADARIVAFPGHRDPAQYTHLPWVKEHWR